MLVLFLKSIVKILYLLFKINKHFYIFVNYYNNKTGGKRYTRKTKKSSRKTKKILGKFRKHKKSRKSRKSKKFPGKFPNAIKKKR